MGSISSKIRELIRRSDGFRRGLYQGRGLEFKLRSDERLYKGWRSKTSASSETRHTVRLIYKMVRTLYAELLKGPLEPKVDFKMVDDMDRAEIAEAFLREQAQMANKLYAWQVFTRRKIKNGAGLMRMDWRIHTRTYAKRRLDVDMKTGAAREVNDLIEEPWFKGPVNVPVRLEDFYWDEFGTDMATCSWVAEVVRNFSPQDMVTYIRSGIFTPTSETLAAIADDLGAEYDLVAMLSDEDYITSRNVENDQTWTLVRYYTDDNVFYILNGQYLMNAAPETQVNPFQIRHRHRKPYIHSTFYTTGDFVGEGIAELAGSYQHYATAAVRMELEQIYSAIRRKFIIQEGAVRDMNKLYDETDTAIVALDSNGIKPLDPPATFGAGRNLATSLISDAEQDLGIVPIMQGSRTPGNTSATEAADIGEQIDKQIGAMAQNQIEAAREDMLMTCEFNRLFLDYASVIWKGQKTNLNGELFDLEDLAIDVVPESVLANVGSLAQKRLQVFIQSNANTPDINWPYLRRIDAVRAGLDPTKVFLAPQQPPTPEAAAGAPPPPGGPNNKGGGPGIGNSPQPAGPSPTAMAQALQGLNPNGQSGAGSPQVEMGTSAGEAVMGM